MFLSTGNRRISFSIVSYTFSRVLRLAGICAARTRKPRIHDLRHTFCGKGSGAVLDEARSGCASLRRPYHIPGSHGYRAYLLAGARRVLNARPFVRIDGEGVDAAGLLTHKASVISNFTVAEQACHQSERMLREHAVDERFLSNERFRRTTGGQRILT